MKKFGFIKKVTAAATAAAMVASLGISAFADAVGNPGAGITITDIRTLDYHDENKNGMKDSGEELPDDIYEVTVNFETTVDNTIGMTMLTYSDKADKGLNGTEPFAGKETMKINAIDQISAVSGTDATPGTGSFTFKVTTKAPDASSTAEPVYIAKGKPGIVALSGDKITSPATVPIVVRDIADSAAEVTLEKTEVSVDADKKDDYNTIEAAILAAVQEKSVDVYRGSEKLGKLPLSTATLKNGTSFTENGDNYTGTVVIPAGTISTDNMFMTKTDGVEVAVTAAVGINPVAATQITKVGGNAAVDNKFAIELGEDELDAKDIAGIKAAVAARALKATVADATGNVTYDVPITAGMLGTEADYGSAMDFTLTVDDAALEDSAELTLAADTTVTATISVNVTEKTYIKSIALSGDAINVTVTKGADDNATKTAIVSALNTAIEGRTFTVDTTSGIAFDKVEYVWVVTGSDKAFTATMKATAVTAEDVNELSAGGLPISTPTITITVNEAPAFKYGDVDGNGTVNARDCSYLFKYVGSKSWDSAIKDVEQAPLRADVDKNGAVNARDASYIFKHIADKTYELPVKVK